MKISLIYSVARTMLPMTQYNTNIIGIQEKIIMMLAAKLTLVSKHQQTLQNANTTKEIFYYGKCFLLQRGGVRVPTSQRAHQTLLRKSYCAPSVLHRTFFLSSLGLSLQLSNPHSLLRSSQPHLEQHSYKAMVLTWGQHSPYKMKHEVIGKQSGEVSGPCCFCSEKRI